MARNAIGRFLCCATLVCASVLNWSAASNAKPPKYTAYELSELAVLADIVVAGEIVKVENQTFVLRIEHKIVGEPPQPTLQIQRFEDWACAQRWAPYAVGQRVVVFLSKPKRAGDFPVILSGGGEGEMSLNGTVVELRMYELMGDCMPLPAPQDRLVSRSRVELDELDRAVRGLREQVEWEIVERLGYRSFAVAKGPRISLASFEAFAESSRCARHLCAQARRSRTWTGPRSSQGNRIAAGELKTLVGAKPGAGTLVASIGDVDGDGNGDLACLTPKVQGSSDEAGALWVLLLDSAGLVRARTRVGAADGVLSREVHQGLDRATTLIALGDLNADGTVDIAFGSPDASGAEGEAGAVWAFFLNRQGQVASSSNLGSSPILLEAEPVERKSLGRALANLGDVDGDGRIELAIGAELRASAHDPTGRAVFIASVNREGQVTRALPSETRDDTFERGMRFSPAMASLGDLDGDGVSELAIGAPDDGAAIWITFMLVDGRARDRQLICFSEGGFVGDLAESSGFGRSLCAPGDLDGDSVPDLLVGSAEGVWTLLLASDGTVKRHRKLEDGPRDIADATHFGDSLTLMPRHAPTEPIMILCGGTRGSGAAATPVLWRLTLGPDGTLRPR